MRILISPRFAKKVTLIMFLTALVLALVSFAAQLGLKSLSQLMSRDLAKDVTDIVNVNAEQNIPTWFSSSMLLLNSVLLAAISSTKRAVGDKYVTHWRALSIIFLVLSLDEIAGVHDRVNPLLSSVLHTGGIFTYSWVVLYSAFVLFFLLAYLKFFLALPARTKRLFFAAGVLYVGGALGMEMVVGYMLGAVDSRAQLLFRFEETIEEFLEMTGAITFFYALTVYCEGSPVIRMQKQNYPESSASPED